MKSTLKKTLSIILTILMIVTTVPFAFAAEEGNVVILYTNDVHCAYADYPVLAAYRAELIAEGNTVITVDAGDAIQGEVIGALTEGEAIVDIMNTVGYDYAVPGNHEFDYGMDVFLGLAQNEADYKYISSNFCDLRSLDPVFEPYYIEDISEDMQIAFVGISTPETVTKSTPEYFKDEGGNFVYGFPTYDMQDDVLCDNIQESVDNAIADGADIVVAVGHLGIEGVTEGWRSTDVIAHTTGIDYFIDSHSHQTINGEVYKNKDGEDVILTSSGTKFENFGEITLSPDGSVSFDLIDPDTIQVENMSDSAKEAYDTVKYLVDTCDMEVSFLYDPIGTSETKLVAYEEDGQWLVRKAETNAGDFVTDAYRAITGADVAICNGGGVRAEIKIGSVSRMDLMNMNPWNNDMCVIEITGQQLIDVLEHGMRSYPEYSGGFLQVSGVTFELEAWKESPVITDVYGNFMGIDETMERRVTNVKVAGEPIDLQKTYTLAGSEYVLTQGGDGMTMLEGATVVKNEGILCDSELLIKYFTDILGGNITAEQYGNPDGDGRINIIDVDPDNTVETDYEIQYGETITVSAPVYDSGEFSYIKFVPEKDGRFILESDAEEDIDPICELYDADMEYLDSNDDCHGLNFCMDYHFIAGETYYFAVAAYSQEAEFDVTLVCGHTYEDGTCTVCGKVCDHTKTEFLGYCLCGDVFFGTDIADGDDLEHDTAAFNNEAGWYRFVPEESGTFCLESITEPDVNGDPICDLYDANGEWLHSNDDNGESLDFRLLYTFEAGETYYFEVKNYDEDAVFNIKLSRATHTADDGSEHYVEYVAETESDCMEHGYTEGLYCPDCDEYVWGHEEKELSEIHTDYDWDDICDICGEEIVCEEEPDTEEPDTEEPGDDGNDSGDSESPINFFQYIISMIMDFFNRIISFLTSLFK